MARGNNYCCYGVREGRRPGIYYSWADCERQVKHYSGARFKGFQVEKDAIKWLAQAGIDVRNLKPEPSASPTPPPATFDPPVHHSSASSASNARGPFYAVAKGKRPGIYDDWDDCREQVDGFSGARYKKFPTLAGAQEFCAVYGGGGHFSLFKSEAFEPDQKASFSDEWARLSQSQGWARGTYQYQKQRAAALRNEIQTHFFASQSTQLPVVKEEEDVRAPTIKTEEHDGAGLEAISEYNQQRHEAALELLGFQTMCQAVGKSPGQTKAQCEVILNSTLVNIVDLLDARRLGRDTTGLPWTNFAAFKAYTLAPYHDKAIPCKEAQKDPILRCFLQNFSRRGARRGHHVYAHAPTYSARPPIAPPQQQPPAQQHSHRPHHDPHPDPNFQSVTAPPSAAPQDGGVVIKKRAMSEEDDDFGDGGRQEKKVKTEDVIEARVTPVEDVIEAQVIKAVEVTQTDVIQVDDVIVVKEANVKLEQDNEAKEPRRREMKKIQQRWTPSNSIMRNWISSV